MTETIDMTPISKCILKLSRSLQGPSKQTKQRCRELHTQASRILELIHIDLGGYYTPSLTEYRYFLIIVDDYTRYIWIWFLESKDMKATSAALSEFKVYAENQFKCNIKRARTDNGTGEFMNKEWNKVVTTAGIQREPSPPYNQAKNDVAERTIRTIKDVATSMLVQGAFRDCYS